MAIMICLISWIQSGDYAIGVKRRVSHQDLMQTVQDYYSHKLHLAKLLETTIEAERNKQVRIILL